MPLSIYKSSAGSGKTYTLAKAYVKLLIENPLGHPNILAVTFTNKATQEMKERILTFLNYLSHGENDTLLSQISDELKLDKARVAANAEKAFKHLLHEYSKFSVVTIDSFFNRLIKAFVHELGIPLNHELELDTKMVLKKSYDAMLQNLANKKDLQAHLLEFMLSKLENGKGWQVEKETLELGGDLFADGQHPVHEAVRFFDFDAINELLKKCNEFISRLELAFGELADQAFTLMTKHGLLIEDFAYGKSGVANIFNKWKEFRNWDKSFGARPLNAVDEPDNWSTKKSPKKELIERAFYAGLNDLLKKGISLWERSESDFYTYTAIKKNLYVVGILHHLSNAIKKYRDDEEILLISDQNHFINTILKEAEMEFIYEKTGSKFQHILIDEFQDTSKVQWENFKPLITNSIANGNEVLLVGDAKQSIYRWRGGSSDLILQKAAQDFGFRSQDVTKNLAANYRSMANIIDFNNAFFKEIHQHFAPDGIISEASKHEPLRLSYTDVEQKQTSKTQQGGYVRFKYYQGQNNIEKHPLIEADLIAQIQQLKEEGFAYGQMAVLVFKNQEASTVATLLNQHHIPVQSSDSLYLSQSGVVQLLITLLKYVQAPTKIHLKTQLYAQYTQLLETEIDHNNVLKCINESADEFYSLFPPEFKQLILGGIGSNSLLFIRKCLSVFGLENADIAYVQAFMEKIDELSSSQGSSFNTILNWWDETGNKVSIETAKNPEAVVIQTIHKAKGLQYPIVLLPYLSGLYKPKSNSNLWLNAVGKNYEKYPAFPVKSTESLANTAFASDYQDECNWITVDAINALYVALTRAEQRIYMFAAQSKHSNSVGDVLNNRLSKIPGIKSIENGFEYGNEKVGEFPTDFHVQTEIDKIHYNQNEIQLRQRSLQFDLFETVAPRVNGSIVHALLAEIISPKNLDLTLAKAVGNGIIQKDELATYHKMISEILESQAGKLVFNTTAQVFTEKEMLANGQIIIPDRIHISEKEVTVIDFKTGKPETAHHTQVQQYGIALKTAMPDKQVSGMLFYTNNYELVPVDLSFN
ncbi:MAG: UvrD-helicase domain-containing protein [Bacteroidetes bacterium]|nr:UvrD-helicase domain-containing protein [Bacteroidota bacterium]